MSLINNNNIKNNTNMETLHILEDTAAETLNCYDDGLTCNIEDTDNVASVEEVFKNLVQ